MSETKFTPGPWVIDGEWPNNRTKGHGIISGAIGQPHEHRAMVQFVNELDGEPYREGIANGNLIAAAPELYEALENMANDYKEFEFNPKTEKYDKPTFDPDILSRARAVLAKARGEAL